ncbi:MAG: V-type ATP synthase subunit E [Thermoplasmata archaeon]
MAIDDVIKGIYDKGNLELESIRKTTEDQISKILVDAEARAKKIVEDGREKFIRELELEKMRKISSINVELKREYMDSLDKIINDYVNKVKDSIKYFRKTEVYRNYLMNSIEKGLKELNIDNDNAIIQISELDKGLIHSLKNVSINRMLDDLGGVIISTKDGKIISDRSIKNLIEEKSIELKEKIYQKIKEEL